jgi:hypothetical protein
MVRSGRGAESVWAWAHPEDRLHKLKVVRRLELLNFATSVFRLRVLMDLCSYLCIRVAPSRVHRLLVYLLDWQSA